MTFGSLFAGIGGMDLGLERAGMKCKWQVEIDPYCTKVLGKHWPGVKRYGDITTVDGTKLERVDLIAGGFPCVDISSAGLQAGIFAPRSGLWFEFGRIIRQLRPRYVLIENVAALLIRGLGSVLGELAASGYDAEWQVLSAKAFGAPHERERVFIIAYPAGESRIHLCFHAEESARLPDDLANWWSANPWDASESKICHMDDGIPDRVASTSKLGNAVVPQVAEWIGRRIMEREYE